MSFKCILNVRSLLTVAFTVPCVVPVNYAVRVTSYLQRSLGSLTLF